MSIGYNVVREPDHIVYNDIGVDVSAITMTAAGVVVDGGGTPVKSKVFMQEELEGLALFNMPNDNNGTLEAGEESGNQIQPIQHPSKESSLHPRKLLLAEEIYLQITR